MKIKKHLILYYICCAFMFVLTPIIYSKSQLYGYNDFINSSLKGNLIIINAIITIVFTVLLIRKKSININSIVFPISFIIFYIAVFELCILFNNKVMLEDLHIDYYFKFIAIYFTTFNIYYILSIDYKKKNNKTKSKTK